MRLATPSALGMRVLSLPLLLLGTVQYVSAQTPSLTVYYAPGQTPLSNGSTPTVSALPTAYDASLQAYSNVTLSPPAPPAPTSISTSFALPIPSAVPAGASQQQNGSFFGFSVEMSVVNQVLGKNSSLLQVPFLNLMANLQQRSGRINIRVGGNTQESAALVASTPDGRILEKDLSPDASSGTTQTPPIIFTADLIQMMRSISDFVNVHWFLGVPFNDTNWRLEIVETGQAILGDFLIGMQAGNEPDLYPNKRRPADYDEDDYFNEFGELIQALKADPKANASKLLIAPSVSTNWTPEQALFAGTQFLPTYGDSMQAVAVEHYPADNCGVKFPGSGDPIVNPEDVLPSYLSHSSVQNLVGKYANASAYVQANGFPFYMFETNTASCGGFPGLSDAFVAALWGVDYAMQMAYTNFTTALFHMGGQSVSYNPFTPPPTNESVFHSWTVGPIYYSALVTAEALGATGTAQVLDLFTNSDLTPAYGIWEHGSLARVLVINYANDPSGANQITVDISMPDGQLPAQADVKMLLAANVTQKGNYTWAGQTFGGNFESDGRPFGAESITPTTCGGTPVVCSITVPAPGAALVFLSGGGAAADTAGGASTTFSTSSVTKSFNTVSINATQLAESNGHGGSEQRLPLGSTSQGSFKSGAVPARVQAAAALTVLGMLWGLGAVALQAV